MVRISDINDDPDKPAVMLSTHFDTPPMSPGTIDAGMMVGTLMELFKNILTDQNVPKNPIIFAFVNGEEGGLYGSRALMINSTYWMKNVQRFINLDSTGQSGKVIMYRANPSSIVTEYSGVPFPHANVIGDDIMPFLPADTDFTAYTRNSSFRLKGMDFSLYQNGFKYHTLGDSSSLLTKGTIQENGANLAFMIKKYAYDRKGFDTLSSSRYIYFDFLGIYINYSETTSIILNIFFMLLLLTLPWINFGFETGFNCFRRKWLPGRKICFDRFFMPLLILMGYMISIAFGILSSVIFGAFTGGLFPMAWYSSTLLAYLLYGLPCMVGLIAGQALSFHCIFWLYRSIKGIPEHDPFVRLYNREKYIAMMHFFVIVIFMLTVTSLRIGYVFCIGALFLLMTYMLTFLIEWTLKVVTRVMNEKFRKWRKTILLVDMLQRELWSLVPFLCGIVPCILIFDLANRILLLLIPIAGRTSLNGDMAIALIVSLVFCSLFFFLFPWFSRAANYGKICLFFIVSSVLMLFIASVVDPYNVQTPKRYSYSTNMRKSVNLTKDGGISMTPDSIYVQAWSLDRRSAKYLFDKYPNKTDSRIQNLICTPVICEFNTTVDMPFPTFTLSTEPVPLGTKFYLNFTHEPCSHTLIHFRKPMIAQQVEIPETLIDDNSTYYIRYHEKSYSDMQTSFIVPEGKEVTFRFFLNYITPKYTPLMIDLIGNVTNVAYGPIVFRITNFEWNFRVFG